MVRAAALILALLPAPTAAQPSAPAKMIVIHNAGSGVAVTDYPSMARCERARAFYKDRVASSQKPGTTIIPAVVLLCIPG